MELSLLLVRKYDAQLYPMLAEPPHLCLWERTLYLYFKSMEHLKRTIFFLYQCKYFILLPDRTLSLTGREQRNPGVSV